MIWHSAIFSNWVLAQLTKLAKLTRLVIFAHYPDVVISPLSRTCKTATRDNSLYVPLYPSSKTPGIESAAFTCNFVKHVKKIIFLPFCLLDCIRDSSALFPEGVFPGKQDSRELLDFRVLFEPSIDGKKRVINIEPTLSANPNNGLSYKPIPVFKAAIIALQPHFPEISTAKYGQSVTDECEPPFTDKGKRVECKFPLVRFLATRVYFNSD